MYLKDYFYNSIMDIPVIILTPLLLAKQKYHQKMKSNPAYMENRKLHCDKYYQVHKHEDAFKERVSKNCKKYYAKKAEPLLNIII